MLRIFSQRLSHSSVNVTTITTSLFSLYRATLPSLAELWLSSAHMDAETTAIHMSRIWRKLWAEPEVWAGILLLLYNVFVPPAFPDYWRCLDSWVMVLEKQWWKALTKESDMEKTNKPLEDRRVSLSTEGHAAYEIRHFPLHVREDLLEKKKSLSYVSRRKQT